MTDATTDSFQGYFFAVQLGPRSRFRNSRENQIIKKMSVEPKLASIPFEDLKWRKKVKQDVVIKKKERRGDDGDLKVLRREETIRRTEVNNKLIAKYQEEEFKNSFVTEKSYYKSLERDRAEKVAKKSIEKRHKIPLRARIRTQQKELPQLVEEKLQQSQRYSRARQNLLNIYSRYTSVI